MPLAVCFSLSHGTAVFTVAGSETAQLSVVDSCGCYLGDFLRHPASLSHAPNNRGFEVLWIVSAFKEVMWSSFGYKHIINGYINKSKLYFVIQARKLRLGRISFAVLLFQVWHFSCCLWERRVCRSLQPGSPSWSDTWACALWSTQDKVNGLIVSGFMW